MLTRLIWALVAIAPAITTATAIAQSSKGQARFPIRESGYWTCHAGRGHCVYWLDNERIIFNGSEPTDLETLPGGHRQGGRREWRHAIYIWDLKTGEVTKHTDADRASLCHADGYIRYSRTTGDDVVVLAGAIGKEVEVARRKKKEPEETQGWNTRFSCGRYRPQTPSSPRGLKVALKEGHGFLDFGALGPPAERREPVVYFPGDSRAGINLPVARWQLSPVKVVRSDFDDSYLLYGPARRDEGAGVDMCPPNVVERRIYRLTIDGKLSTIPIPAARKLRCYFSFVGVSRAGVLMEVGAGHATNLNASILYLLREGRIEEVARGVAMDEVVSPNGCFLALGISSNADPKKPPSAMSRGHLKVIDFCAKGIK